MRDSFPRSSEARRGWDKHLPLSPPPVNPTFFWLAARCKTMIERLCSQCCAPDQIKCIQSCWHHRGPRKEKKTLLTRFCDLCSVVTESASDTFNFTLYFQKLHWKLFFSFVAPQRITETLQHHFVNARLIKRSNVKSKCTFLQFSLRGEIRRFPGVLLVCSWHQTGLHVEFDTAERDIQNKDGHLSSNVDCLTVTPVLLEFRLRMNKWDSAGYLLLGAN